MRDLLSKLDKILNESDDRKSNSWMRDPDDPESKIPAVFRKEKSAGRSAAEKSIDDLNQEAGAKVWRSPRKAVESDNNQEELYGLRVGDTVRVEIDGREEQGDIIDIFPDTKEVELLLRGPEAGRTVTVDVRDVEYFEDIFQVGDEFGISVTEDFEVGTEIVDILEDGVVIELDDRSIKYLSQQGFTFEDGEIVEGKQHGNSKIYDRCWKGYKKVPGKARGEEGSCEKIGESGLQYSIGVKKHGKPYMTKAAQLMRDGGSQEELGKLRDQHSKAYKNKKDEDFDMDEAKYQGREVPLGKPMKGDVKKSKVYVKNPQGNVVKVNFGDKQMRIKKSNPKRRKSFRARHNCANPGPRHKARYWSCRAW